MWGIFRLAERLLIWERKSLLREVNRLSKLSSLFWLSLHTVLEKISVTEEDDIFVTVISNLNSLASQFDFEATTNLNLKMKIKFFEFKMCVLVNFLGVHILHPVVGECVFLGVEYVTEQISVFTSICGLNRKCVNLYMPSTPPFDHLHCYRSNLK
jgi:hypothetical protein